MNPVFLALADLVNRVGNVAVEMGEEWRLAHPELMDSYEAALDVVNNGLTTGEGMI